MISAHQLRAVEEFSTPGEGDLCMQAIPRGKLHRGRLLAKSLKMASIAMEEVHTSALHSVTDDCFMHSS